MFSEEQLNKFLLSKTEELGIISREHPLDDKLTCSHYLKHNNILESQGEFTCKSPLRTRLKIRKVRKHVSWTNPFLSIMSSLQHRHLISTSQCYKLPIINPTGHVWFGVRVDSRGRGRGWRKGKKTPAWRDCWKAKHPIISCMSLHFWKLAINQSKWVTLNTESTVFWQKKHTYVHLQTEFCKITMTSGMGNLHFPTPTPLLIFDRRPPPRYKFLSLPSLPVSLKSKY